MVISLSKMCWMVSRSRALAVYCIFYGEREQKAPAFMTRIASEMMQNKHGNKQYILCPPHVRALWKNPWVYVKPDLKSCFILSLHGVSMVPEKNNL